MKTLFIDFDSTIVDSSRAVIDVLNKYCIKEKEHKIKETHTLEWNFTDIVPKKYQVLIPSIFETPMFFKELKLFDGVYETLEEISKYTRVVIVSIGTRLNIKQKMDWIETHLPFVEFIPIIKKQENLVMNKSIINMSNGIMIDDHEDNLYSCNADIKVCYANNGYDYSVNRKWRKENDICFSQWRKDVEGKILKAML